MRERRCRIRELAAVLVLLATAALAGCSIEIGGDQSARPEVGKTPPARPGAYVWVVGAPDLVVGSADGGATWKVSNRRPDSDIMAGDLWAVAFGDTVHGWAVRRGIGHEEATVLATTDAGASWTWQRPGTPNGRLLAVAATDADHVWAVGYQRIGESGDNDRGLVLASADGGATWERQKLPAGLAPFRVAFGDVRHGWLIAGGTQDRGAYHVLSTSDGGEHWRVCYSPQVTLTAVAAAGADRCWVTGSTSHPQSGFVADTSDGGRHWTAHSGVSPEPLWGVSFIDGRRGWAVGPRGTIIATKDGGTTWMTQDAGGGYDLEQVSFSDPRHGWALIGHVALLATVDAGRSWSVVRPSEEEELFLGLEAVGTKTTGQP